MQEKNPFWSRPGPTLTLHPGLVLAACPGLQTTCSQPPSVHTPPPVLRGQDAPRRGPSSQLKQPSSPPPLSPTPSSPLPPVNEGGKELEGICCKRDQLQTVTSAPNRNDLLSFPPPFNTAKAPPVRHTGAWFPSPHMKVLQEVGTAIISTRDTHSVIQPPMPGNTTPFL